LTDQPPTEPTPEATSPPRAMPAGLRLAALGFAAAALGAIGYVAYERLAVPAPVAVTANAAANAATLPVPATGVANTLGQPAVPEMRPDFTLKDLDGQPVALSRWNGKAVVVNFWATWCGPCQREIPLLNRMHAEYAPQGIQLVGVAVDFADDVRQFTTKTKLDYPTLMGEEDGAEAARAFGIDSLAFPFTAFTDKAGRVVTVHLGELHEPQLRAILDAIVAIDAGKLTLEAARARIEAAD
jgi:thiol-disulfide isomerase/thioredoxin